MKASRLLFSVLLLSTGACARGEHLNGPVPKPVRTARSTYSAEPRPDSGAIAAWDAAGSAALRSRVLVLPDFTEILVFPAHVALAAAYRIPMRRGEKIDIEIRTEQGATPFADVFEVIDSSMFRHVHAPARNESHFSYTATIDGEHILRVQPPLDEPARYRVHVTASGRSGLTFPVEGASPAAIAGQWGDPRDDGARSHKGVDIFATRGTPVLAASSGVITSVENTEVGGRVVWEKDERQGLLYYYAHLDEQLVQPGRRVEAGEIIGKVGNTGNASGGSPHLHFGVFLPDYTAQNPTYYLTSAAMPAQGESSAPEPSELGMKMKLTGDHVRLRASPGEAGAVIEQLDAGTDLLLIGSLNGWMRVVLDDGTTGFVAGWLIGAERSSSARSRR